MAAHTVADATLVVGEPMVLHGPSPTTPFLVVFEDDGETGYFYGLDTSRRRPILDALQVQFTRSPRCAGRDRPATARSATKSSDGLKAVLLIDGRAHAVFDFASNRAYCRTGSPPPDPEFTDSHAWDDAAIGLFG